MSDSVNSLLNKIPGYGGYRDRERRRESDRLIRETLARDYQNLVDRIGRIAQRLAEEREVRSIQLVDTPQKRLTHFISRLRNATYGYAPLFGERPVNQGALDQIAEFDRALAEHVDPISERITALENADPSSPEFRQIAQDIRIEIDRLHERFDRRGEVIESGEPQPEESVRALLAPPVPARHPTAFNLHDGEAVTYGGQNYVVVGRITVESNEPLWRDFQLRGADEEYWLRVPAVVGGSFFWLNEIEVPEQIDVSEIFALNTSYEVQERFEARAEVIGPGGRTEDRSVTVLVAHENGTHNVLCVYDWGTDQLALAGSEIDPVELELWSREGGDAV